MERNVQVCGSASVDELLANASMEKSLAATVVAQSCATVTTRHITDQAQATGSKGLPNVKMSTHCLFFSWSKVG